MGAGGLPLQGAWKSAERLDWSSCHSPKLQWLNEHWLCGETMSHKVKNRICSFCGLGGLSDFAVMSVAFEVCCVLMHQYSRRRLWAWLLYLRIWKQPSIFSLFPHLSFPPHGLFRASQVIKAGTSPHSTIHKYPGGFTLYWVGVLARGTGCPWHVCLQTGPPSQTCTCSYAPHWSPPWLSTPSGEFL